MTDLALILLTVVFFAAVAVVARRAASREPAPRDPSAAPQGRRR
jgi:hypothetical protein